MRKLRELVPGGTYHVSARINNRELHLQEVLCKSIMLEIMEKLQTEMGFKFEHFAIMDNHVHFIISTLDMELPKIMQFAITRL
ncbi:MAG TPA: transposase [Spirochaetia bacterium]|nr:transposase [Spirochaetia bacterium]